ncbi:unnamed protein product [Tilletia controversa]|uniref:J domain-containing protein n=2 Tax=Tilletia TaxID=13289 RepID=A0A177V6W8_9BASI|nr:hypothetical protein CF336_g2646 [Tilletia laevis]KAE8262893.1 hypothetical protein A4X03_0g2089 [Tilletia caries]CAD6947589.1 unnamed protein product [Tilletia controversa]KAE8206516.1 hypothetical protein CF335_g1839 [Tilletia laevis]CAD6886440.1 unnamed protein product [Tilletia caries]
MTSLRTTARLLPRLPCTPAARPCGCALSRSSTASSSDNQYRRNPAPSFAPFSSSSISLQQQQKPSKSASSDVYELFGLSLQDLPQNGWGVDEKDVKSTWRKLMGGTHPDRMAGRSEEEQAEAAQQSTVVNRAYETLFNPLLRAQHLLERHGITSSDEAEGLDDPDLLLQVMEFRERLEEASSESEAAEVRADNREHLEHTLTALGNAFGASPPDLEQARKLTIELRYWLNIDKAAREWAPGARVELQH